MFYFLELVHFVNHFCSFGIKAKELFGQTINETRKCPSICNSFFVGNIKIEVTAMNGFIARQAASICQLLHPGAEVETFNFLEKIVPAGASFNRQFFQASPKEYACGPWRKVCNALSFIENGCNCFWHVFRRLYGSTVGINHFAVFPKCDFPAVSANLNEALIWIKKLKKISRNDIGFPIGNHSYQINALGSLVQLGNQLIHELTVVPTVWASKGF